MGLRLNHRLKSPRLFLGEDRAVIVYACRYISVFACAAALAASGCAVDAAGPDSPAEDGPTAEDKPALDESTDDQTANEPQSPVVTTTSGGGFAATDEHTLQLSVGGPQPTGQATTESHRIRLGPGAGIAP